MARTAVGHYPDPKTVARIATTCHHDRWSSGTLMAFARVCNLRCKPDTQLETQMIAEQIDTIGKKEFPISWKALRS